MLNSREREVEKAQRDIAKIKNDRAKLATKIANKKASLESYKRRLTRE